MSDAETGPEQPVSATPTPRKPRGCSTAALVICGLGALTLLVCCGIGGFFAWQFWPKMTNNPAEVAEISRQILDLQIPDDFQADTAMSMGGNFAMSMRMAMYKHREEKGSLVIGDFHVSGGAQVDKPDIKQKMNQKLNLQMGDSKVREFQVRGRKVPFRFTEAVDQETKRKFRVVEGDLQSPAGMTFLMMVLEEDVYDDDAAVKMIESIR